MHRPEVTNDHSELYRNKKSSPLAFIIAGIVVALVLVGAFYILQQAPSTQEAGMATNIQGTIGEQKQYADFLIGTHEAESSIDLQEVMTKPEAYTWQIIHLRGEVAEVPNSRVLMLKSPTSQENEIYLPVINMATPVWERVLNPGHIVIAKGRIEPLDLAQLETSLIFEDKQLEPLAAYAGQPVLVSGWTSSIAH
ncbi:MAG: hypothetical protein ACOH5I_09185 [Oligoflexus sp.]